MKTIASCVLAGLIVATFTWTDVSGQEWGKVTEPEWQIVPPDEFPNASAVILFDIGQATAELRGLEFKRHVRIKVFSAADLADLGDLEIEYFDYDHLHHLKAQIIRPDGSILKVGKNDFEKTEEGSRRTSRIRFSNVADGDILEYSYGIDYYGGIDKLGPEKYFLFGQDNRYGSWKSRDRRGSDGWDEGLHKNITNLPSWFFDHLVPCLRSQFTAKLGSDLDYTYFTTNVPDELISPVSKRIKVLSITAYKAHTWEVRDIPPFVPDTLSFFDEEVRRTALHFQLFSTRGQNRVLTGVFTDKHWQHIGQSFQGYLHEYVKRPR